MTRVLSVLIITIFFCSLLINTNSNNQIQNTQARKIHSRELDQVHYIENLINETFDISEETSYSDDDISQSIEELESIIVDMKLGKGNVEERSKLVTEKLISHFRDFRYEEEGDSDDEYDEDMDNVDIAHMVLKNYPEFSPNEEYINDYTYNNILEKQTLMETFCVEDNIQYSMHALL